MKQRWRTYPAPRLILLFAAVVPIAFVGVFIPVWNAAVLVWGVVVLLTAIADRILHAPCELEIHRKSPRRMVIGEIGSFQLEFRASGNHTALYSGADCLPRKWEGEQDIPQFFIPPGESTIVKMEVRPLRRGAFSLGPLHMIQESGFRLWRHHRAFETPEQVKVYPDYQPGQESLDHLKDLGDLGIRRTRQRGEGTDFESLREYRMGDDSARIDWKATSRLGKPVSRQYTIEKDHDVVIGLDCGRLMGAEFKGVAKFDHALRATLALAETSLRAGDRVGVMVFDAKVRCYVPPAKGLSQLGLILDALHGIESDLVETDFARALSYLGMHHRKRSLVVLFTDFIDKHTAGPMLMGLATVVRRHVCLFVAVEDPTLKERLAELPMKLSDMAGQAVAYGMQSDRREVLAILKQQGVEVLNQQPDNLTAPVINSYLFLKDSNRL